MEVKIEYFDQPLFSCNFCSGYRIHIKNSTLPEREVVNFLSDSFGEGVVDNTKYNSLKIDSDTWHFFIIDMRYTHYIVVLNDKDQVDRFMDHFNLNTKIDYNSLSIKHKLRETLEKYLYELNTQKIKNKIREDVRKILHVKPYDFELVVDSNGIKIKSNDFDFFINGYQC